MVEKKRKSSVSKEKVEKVRPEREDVDSEPSWYHYLIVVGVFALVIGVLWGGYYYFVDVRGDNLSGNQSEAVLYKYVHRVGNVSYNLYFESPLPEVGEMDYVVEPDKYDVLNTVSFRMAFMEYNGSDNGQVAKASTKLTSFLKFVYHFRFANESFGMVDDFSCEDSSMRSKVITFNPYENVTGIFMDERGCIEFKSDEPEKLVDLVDKFMYEMVEING